MVNANIKINNLFKLQLFLSLFTSFCLASQDIVLDIALKENKIQSEQTEQPEKTAQLKLTEQADKVNTKAEAHKNAHAATEQLKPIEQAVQVTENTDTNLSNFDPKDFISPLSENIKQIFEDVKTKLNINKLITVRYATEYEIKLFPVRNILTHSYYGYPLILINKQWFEAYKDEETQKLIALYYTYLNFSTPLTLQTKAILACSLADIALSCVFSRYYSKKLKQYNVSYFNIILSNIGLNILSYYLISKRIYKKVSDATSQTEEELTKIRIDDFVKRFGYDLEFVLKSLNLHQNELGFYIQNNEI